MRMTWMADRARRERALGIAACGCVGGFLASTFGHYLGGFPGMDLAAAGAAAIVGAWADTR